MNGSMEHPQTEQEVLQVFQVFDQTGEGFISETDLRHIMSTCLGERMGDDDIDEMIQKEAVVNEEGFIDYVKFTTALMKR